MQIALVLSSSTGMARFAAATGAPAPLVTAVEVRGAPPSLAPSLGKLVRLAAGDRLDEARLSEDERRLWASGLVDDVRAATEPRGDGVALVLTVQPRRRLRHLQLGGGVDARLAASLQKELPAGKLLPPSEIARLRAGLREGFLSLGHPWAQPQVTTQPVGDGEIDVAVDVAPGPRAQLELTVHGNRALATDELRKVMGDPVTWVDDEARARAMLRVAALYYDHGYINVRPRATARADREHERVVAAIDIDEGNQYRLRGLALRGGDGPTGCEAARGVALNRSAVTRCLEDLRQRSGKKVDVETKIDERARAVDLTFVESEGVRAP